MEENILDLAVIDLYQGNSKRAVQTLSSGESFMLSLALGTWALQNYFQMV